MAVGKKCYSIPGILKISFTKRRRLIGWYYFSDDKKLTIKKPKEIMEKLELNSDTVQDIFYKERSRFVWEMDHDTFLKIQFFTNAQGRHVWVPDTEHPSKNGSIMGLDVVISDEPGIRLVTIFRKSEHSKLVILEE